MNGTSGITLTQGASAGDIIEFVMRNTSNSGFSAANTGQIVDQAVTFDKLSNSGTEADNVQKRVASAWVNFDGTFGSTPYTKSNGIRSAYNVASVTDNGSGDYTVNFERTFGSSDDYAAVVTNSAETAGSTIPVFHQNGIATSSTGAAFRFRLSDAGSYATRRNSLTVAVAVFGELSMTRTNNHSNIHKTMSSTCEGRLTLESGVAVSTTNQTAKTTVYFTPYIGTNISLYDGSDWDIFTFGELSLSISGYTADTNYDIFVYDNSGTLTLNQQLGQIILLEQQLLLLKIMYMLRMVLLHADILEL